ncbi:chromosomal replication initiator protein DnaA [Pseudanabaena sp. FACHB-1998]|uniref:chromosomal replication initiator protein DnaA n=1 Tax=Pseudanabaena sp. FACHB-1998 TaxID=2692858 RepID=UPI0016819C5C|nr:chromosomal replication initiator protein DnaA [Pseudanabaena sp. FACHB-1998]MBD2175475.1 chromosomal replication initiator protein DnaA [Pseudanabaena sp. FACHB-1998]
MSVDISLETLWNQVLELLESQLSRPTYEGWIKTVVADELTADRLTIRTPSTFAKNWLHKYYFQNITDAVSEILGYPVEVHIVSAPSAEPPSGQPEELNEDEAEINQDGMLETAIAAEAVQAMASAIPSANNQANPQSETNGSAPRPSNLNPKYNFNRFVVGSTNRMAHAAALAVSELPGREFNPLFLCGGVGLGKTHLMQAIAHYRLEIEPKARIAYVSTEQFTNDLISAIRKDSMQRFRELYREIDMLIIDDIQFIEGKEYTQEEFFHTFNTLYETGKQIVLASDRPPAQIPRLQERLCSRFSMGLIADIQVPDLETRMAILQKKAEYDNLKIPTDVLHYIAASYTSNIRELEGALVRTVAYISISGLPMTVENVAPVLNPPKEPVEVSAEMVLSVVTEMLNIELSDLLGNSRRREISQARQIVMYLMRQHTNLSLPKIGEAVGGKDHTTVMYSCEKVAQLQSTDGDIAQLLRQLSDRIYLVAQTKN